jgi:hypothetical protein
MSVWGAGLVPSLGPLLFGADCRSRIQDTIETINERYDYTTRDALFFSRRFAHYNLQRMTVRHGHDDVVVSWTLS